jgi:hypothetical protein
VAPVPVNVGLGTTRGLLDRALTVTVWLASSVAVPGPAATPVISTLCGPASSATI